MLDVRFSHLYFCQSLHTLQRGLTAIADLLVKYCQLAEFSYPSAQWFVRGISCASHIFKSHRF